MAFQITAHDWLCGWESMQVSTANPPFQEEHSGNVSGENKIFPTYGDIKSFVPGKAETHTGTTRYYAYSNRANVQCHKHGLFPERFKAWFPISCVAKAPRSMN